MQDLIKKYNISPSFFDRYFKQNAEFRFGVETLQFLFFKKGKFLSPLKKDFYLEQFIKEEIDSFYNKNELNIPQFQFNITTKCSLKCVDCGSLIPQFTNANHINLNYEDFTKQLDMICNSVTKIRRFILIGGEPLLHKGIAKMLDYACKKSNLDTVEIISNGTIIPQKDLLEVMQIHNQKAYLYLSNYSSNIDLIPQLKYEEIKQILKKYNIKIQMVPEVWWVKERGFSTIPMTLENSKKRYENCYFGHCTQILNGKIYVCAKASSAIELGLVHVNDYIDLNKEKNLRQAFIDFYNQSFFQACQYCNFSNQAVMPALQ